MACVPPVDGVEATDGATEETSDDGDPLTSGPATDSLGGTGMTPPPTDGTTSIGVDDSGVSTNGDDPDPSTTEPGDVSTSGDDDDDAGSSSDTEGTSTPATTDATDSSDTDDTSDVVCEEMDYISCDALEDSPSIFNAIGLGCEGDPSETIPIGTWTFPPATDPDSWGIATQFGTHVDAMGDPTFGVREGESFLVLSTGNGVNPNEDGLLTFGTQDDDTNDNPDNSVAPAPIVWPYQGNDLVWFQVEIQAPPGVEGFALDVAFFSEEFPEWVGTNFNDALVVWVDTSVTSADYCGFTGEPCTVTALWPTPYQPGDDELVGTGFQGDGSTGWRTLRGPAVPGEALQLTVALFDGGDTAFNAMALLDAFRWECEGCNGIPGNECGFQP